MRLAKWTASPRILAIGDGALAEGRLKRVLEDWCPPFSGHRLYDPSRRQYTPALALLIEPFYYYP